MTDLNRFIPGPRPQRLYPVSEADLNLWITDIEPPPTPLQGCLEHTALVASLRATGWKEAKGLIETGPLPEGVSEPNAEMLGHGRKQVLIHSHSGTCIRSLVLIQNPQTPDEEEKPPAASTGTEEH